VTASDELLDQSFGSHAQIVVPWPTPGRPKHTSLYGLDRVADMVSSCSNDQRDELLGHLRIGLQSNTEVTFETAGAT
jgi:hypothetical protein